MVKQTQDTIGPLLERDYKLYIALQLTSLVVKTEILSLLHKNKQQTGREQDRMPR